MADKELSFEEALEKLESCVNRVSSQDTTIEEAIKAYEEGASYYTKCDLILKEARQRIEVVDTASGGKVES